jgi:hypothetical protein
MSSSNSNQQAWDFAKNSLRLSGLSPSQDAERAANFVISGAASWDEVIAIFAANGWRSFPQSLPHVQ